MTTTIEAPESPGSPSVPEGTTPRKPAAGRFRRILRRLRRSYDSHWYAWAMVLPVVLVLGVLVGYPLVRGLYYSLTDINEANMGRTIGVNHIPATYEWVGLKNYRDVLSGSDGNFYPKLQWTLIWTVSCVVLHYTLGLGLAVLLNRKVRFSGMYRIMLVVPWAVPAFVSAFAWRLMLNKDNGVINSILGGAGMDPVDWLGQPTTAKIAVIMVNVWIGAPFNMVAILGGLQAIPKEQYEAAEMDGATPWQRFRYVTMPGLRPISATIILLGVIWTFNQFAVIYLVTEGGPFGSTEILVTFAYKLGFANIRDYAGAATYGAIILSMLILFATAYRRTLDRKGQETA
ncbi:carbohydrate ABC transporter permease [Embleya scabrispora]|uniref:carbohydrate ABC transporter permease n=1 Tax=Embleya scabrispora TaxID=159449 RepID=UPI00036969B8|nr:sugar ABC transporter permease [Embleya scabrispora]MYS84785.1 ABC transporter permease subunit [Streptomyces sp. SID5474]